MSGKVFISCGQATDEERNLASDLKEWFRRQGFDPYVAIQVQSIQDVNSGIIGELRKADYYVFVDFPREGCVTHDGKQVRRGSLFTNQELAIAYILGFDSVLFFQHKDIVLEGLLRYMAANATKFERSSDIVDLVRNAVAARGWNPRYSRHLLATNLNWSSQLIRYTNPRGLYLVGRFLYVSIENRRNDIGAVNTVARLARITCPDGQELSSPDSSYLKATAVQGYTHLIWPESSCTFDLLVVCASSGHIYLNSSLDIAPLQPIIATLGDYLLHYEVFAESFPVLQFSVRLQVTGDVQSTVATLE
jgi:hypothetical protein